MDAKPTGNIEDKHIEMWKIKRLIKKLDSSKGLVHFHLFDIATFITELAILFQRNHLILN